MPKRPVTVARRLGGNTENMANMASGSITPAASPCTARASTMMPKLGAVPPITEAAMNTRMAPTKL